jgi:hypothetical protein
MAQQTNRPSVREINQHLRTLKGYAYVVLPNGQFRISAIKTIDGQLMGKSIRYAGQVWLPIPDDAKIDLTY